MNENAPAQALDTAQPVQAVTRWLVLLRGRNGKAEILGQVHASEPEAVESGRFWQAHQRALGLSDCAAEVVSFEVPVRGTPVRDGRDLLP